MTKFRNDEIKVRKDGFLILTTPPSATGLHQGSIELTLADRRGRTCIVRSRTRPPLQVQRALYPDPAMPNLAMVMLSNPTGGIFQSDHHLIAVSLEPGAAAHVTGQGATRIHAMPQGFAQQDVVLKVAEGGYLEYLPDPVIPYRDSDFDQHVTLTVAPGGTLVFWDIIAPGRLAMGEAFRYRRLASQLVALDCNGRPAYCEAFTLEPSRGLPLERGLHWVRPRKGSACTMGSMLVIAEGQELVALLAELQSLLPTLPGVAAGATLLPYRLGVGVRALGDETSVVRDALAKCWAATRKHLLGTAVPFLRKY